MKKSFSNRRNFAKLCLMFFFIPTLFNFKYLKAKIILKKIDDKIWILDIYD